VDAEGLHGSINLEDETAEIRIISHGMEYSSLEVVEKIAYEYEESPEVEEQDKKWKEQIAALIGNDRRSLQNLEAGSVDIHLHFEIDAHMKNTLGSYAAARYAVELVAVINRDAYFDLGFNLKVVSINIRSGNLAASTSASAYLTQLEKIPVPENVNLVHSLTTRIIGGGIAYMGGVYSRRWAYGVSGNIGGSFSMWDRTVLAHELGHNFGADHTHQMSPPVDRCGINCSGSRIGTIMSYCHLCHGGFNNMRFRWAERVRDTMLTAYHLRKQDLNRRQSCNLLSNIEPDMSVQFYLRGDSCLTFSTEECGQDCRIQQCAADALLQFDGSRLRSSKKQNFCLQASSSCDSFSLRQCSGNNMQQFAFESGNVISDTCGAVKYAGSTIIGGNAGRAITQWCHASSNDAPSAPTPAPTIFVSDPPSQSPTTWSSDHTLLFRQTMPFMWPRGQFRLNADNEESDNFSILDELEQFRSLDGRFYFRMTWPGSNMVYQWSQTSNPTSETISGYQAISIPYSGHHWGGLAPSGNDALIDGSPGHWSWFYAIGSHVKWRNAIPAYGQPRSSVELYVRMKHSDSPSISPTVQPTSFGFKLMNFMTRNDEEPMCMGDPEFDGELTLQRCSTLNQKLEWHGRQLNLVDTNLCFTIDRPDSPKTRVPHFAECDSSNSGQLLNVVTHDSVDMGDVLSIGYGPKYLETIGCSRIEGRQVRIWDGPHNACYHWIVIMDDFPSPVPTTSSQPTMNPGSALSTSPSLSPVSRVTTSIPTIHPSPVPTDSSSDESYGFKLMFFVTSDEVEPMCLGDPNFTGEMNLYRCNGLRQKWEWRGNQLNLVDTNFCFTIDNADSPKRQVPYFADCDNSNPGQVLNIVPHAAVELGDVLALGVGSNYLETSGCGRGEGTNARFWDGPHAICYRWIVIMDDLPSGESTSVSPSIMPSAIPSIEQTSATPSKEPTSTFPSMEPTSTFPSMEPTSTFPSMEPTSTIPSMEPTSTIPSMEPTSTIPSIEPSASPLIEPSSSPSFSPTIEASSNPTLTPTPSPTEDGVLFYKALNGCSRNGLRGSVGFYNPSRAIAKIHCCSLDGASCTRKHPGPHQTCMGNRQHVTWAHAKQVCEAEGMRLCNSQEEVNKCCGSGCGYDGVLTWTSISQVVRSHYVACGRPNRCNVASKVSQDNVVRKVRCVSNSRRPGWTSNPNQCGNISWESNIWGSCKSLTFEAATNFCASKNARLPTREEAESGCVAGSGCGFDAQFVWTSTSA